MSSPPPPPPPPRKPPSVARPPAAPLPPEEPEPPGTSPGLIMGVIAAALFVVVGLPILACGGCVIYTRHQVQKFDEAVNTMQASIDQEQQQLEEIRQQALLVELADQLYPLAKVDIGQHWVEPEGVRRRSWSDWAATKIDERRYEVVGKLDLGMKEGRGHSYRWTCTYSTHDDPHNPTADWTLERITIDGEPIFP